MITKNNIESAMSYEGYNSLISELLPMGKTTGEDQSEEYLKFSELNVSRMKRLNKTVSLSEDLLQNIEQINIDMIWIVVTEAWCGDAAQILPVINKIAMTTPKIELKILLRDDNPEVMNQFLTNGSKSIPKLIVLDKYSLEILNVWGPRPAAIQAVMTELKNSGVSDHQIISEKIQLAYTKDKTIAIQSELSSIIMKFVKK